MASNRQRRYRIRAHFPIMLYLRDHASIIGIKTPTLAELAQDYFNENKEYSDLKLPVKWFEWQLRRNNCIMLLDGLDEVAELEQRKAVSKWVDQQIINYPRCFFILTA